MKCSDRRYKHALTDFITSMTWHWFITIRIGDCEADEVVLKRLRRIENELCKRYLINRYWKLPANARFTMAIAFEGERELGTRHAHMLAYVPQPTKKRISQEMAIGLFPSEFRGRWVLQSASTNSDSNLTKLPTSHRGTSAWRGQHCSCRVYSQGHTTRGSCLVSIRICYCP